MINLKKLRKFFHAARIAGIINQIGRSVFHNKSEYKTLFYETGKFCKRLVPLIEKQKEKLITAGKEFFDALNKKKKHRS